MPVLHQRRRLEKVVAPIDSYRRRAEGKREMQRPGVVRYQQRGALEQAAEARQRQPAAEVDGRIAHRGNHRLRDRCFVGGCVHRDDGAGLHETIRHCGKARCRPVAARIAGSRLQYDQRRMQRLRHRTCGFSPVAFGDLQLVPVQRALRTDQRGDFQQLQAPVLQWRVGHPAVEWLGVGRLQAEREPRAETPHQRIRMTASHDRRRHTSVSPDRTPRRASRRQMPASVRDRCPAARRCRGKAARAQPRPPGQAGRAEIRRATACRDRQFPLRGKCA